MFMSNERQSLAPVVLLTERASGPGGQPFNPAVAFERKFRDITANYDRPAGTVYGRARELAPAEQELIMPAATVAGALAIGRYSVGPEQSEAAKARIAEHEAWVNSGQRKQALAEVIMTQAIIDAQVHAQLQREAERWFADLLDDDEDDDGRRTTRDTN
jgi:hypothetical protein